MIRLLLAGGISLVVSLVGTRFLITWLTTHRIGQPIHEDVPDGHTIKAGTPTMGGIAVVSGACVGYLTSQLLVNLLNRSGDQSAVFTRTGLYVMLAISGAALVGLIDDWIKVANEKNSGLSKKAKMLGLLAVAVGFALLVAYRTDIETTVSFTRWSVPGISIAKWVWVLWAVLLISGAANAVNLTDGLDGLAAGAASLAFGAFTVICFWQFRYPESVFPDLYRVAHALDLAVVAVAMLGGCVGFLWWNAAPARIFMGDTGSLAIGTALACLALTSNTQLLLPVIGALFVAETVSVVLQVASFRLTGRRIFRMAPIHHHFELKGWPETTVIIRFWILSGLCTALGLGLFDADFLRTGESRQETGCCTPALVTAATPAVTREVTPAAVPGDETAGTSVPDGSGRGRR